MLYAMMSATAGSTSDSENNCSLRVTSEALPYSLRVTETVLILDNQMNFIEKCWSKKITDDIVWPTLKRKYLRYKPFLHYDTDTFKNLTKDIIKEYA